MLVRTQYEQLVYTLPARYPSICMSTLVLAPPGLDTARLTGLVALGDDCALCVYELLDSNRELSKRTATKSRDVILLSPKALCLKPLNTAVPATPSRINCTGTIRGLIPTTRRWPLLIPTISIYHRASSTIASQPPT